MPIEENSTARLLAIEANAFFADLAGANVPGSIEIRFLNLLGCPFSNSGVYYTKPVERDHILALNDVLPKVLTAIVARIPDFCSNVSSVLGAINRQGCLSSCLETREGAYAMAVGLCYFIDTLELHGSLDQDVAPDVLNLLSSWIKPAIEWDEIPSSRTVAAALFGEHWCHFKLTDDMDYLPGSAMWNSDWILAYIVAKERPPFLTGLCPAQDAIMSAPLPELGLSL